MADAVEAVAMPPVFEVVLDRPPANAIDAATSRELGAAFTRFRDDPKLRVAILVGGGERFFSAGWDLKAAASGEPADADYGPGGFGGFPALPGLHKPVIAAVNGMAVGGGFELALAADLVVAAEHAELWLPEAAVGLVPDIGSVRLSRALPGPLANELLLTGRRMGAAEAARWGLVNRVVPGAQVIDAARVLAAEVAAAAPLAVEAILAIGRQVAEQPFAVADLPEYRRAVSSEDAREGAAAFAEKRPPKWTGR